jgi:Mg-chelatase subunit ChlD
LKWLIEGLEEQGIVKPTGEAPGFLLTGLALDVLLRYLTGGDGPVFTSTVRGAGPAFTSNRSHEVRRYSQGDTFRDLSVRHTLREVARRKKVLRQIGQSELRVFLKERRSPQSDMVICVDTSGSMGFDHKLMCARVAAAGLSRSALLRGDRAGLVAFSDYGQTVLPLTANDGELLLNGIAGLSAGGNTNIGDGLRSARELLLKGYNRNRKHIILITDGRASAVSEAAAAELGMNSGSDLTEQSAILETSKAAAAGVQVSVIYVAPRDQKVDDFVRSIARSGRGQVQRMTGLADLGAGLASRLGTDTSVIGG